MKKIIGLDLGTTSIGWALVNEAQNDNEHSSIIANGSRVIPLTTDEQECFEKGKSITTNADRRLKHGARLNLHRFKMRRDNLIALLIAHNIISNKTNLAESGAGSTFETIRLRAMAATDRIGLEDFGRILLMINKKRGYKSSRKSNDPDADGTAVNSMDIARELYENNITPGQYTYNLLKGKKKHIPDFYRSDLSDELYRIYQTQKQFYPVLNDETFTQISNKNEKVTWAIIAQALDLKGIKRTTKGLEQKLEDYSWRVKGLTEQLAPEQVAIVLSNINKQIVSSSGYLGAISDRSKQLIIENKTVGQYIWDELSKNPHFSTRNKAFYRQDYLDEFEQIWATQAKFHPVLTSELKKEIRDVVIFYQRQLKSQKNSVAYCEFESQNIEIEEGGRFRTKTIGMKVAPKSSPIFQEFKIWQTINNIRVTGSEIDKLTDDQRHRLFIELNYRDKMSQNDVLKFLFKRTNGLSLNVKELDGNKTNALLLKKYLSVIDASGHNAEAISKLPSKEKIEAIASVFEILGIDSRILSFDSCASNDNFSLQPAFRLWHLLYSYEGDNSRSGIEALKDCLCRTFGFSPDLVSIIASTTFPPAYGNISTKAIRRIIPFLIEGYDYSEACKNAGYRHSARSLTREELNDKKYCHKLDLIKPGELRNPVVEKVLNQMINVVNLIIEQYGYPDEIRVELARDLKKTAAEREEMFSSINKSQKDNDEIRKQLIRDFNIANPSRNDIIRYKLYLELSDNGFKTLYSSTYIPRDEIFGSKFNIEHIIPQSRLFDDSFSNKTLEACDINIEKGNDTAIDYVKHKYGEAGVEEYRRRAENLFKHGKISKTKLKKLLMPGSEIPDDFISRDLNNTRYISRKAYEILEDISPVVTPTTGIITDRLRNDWQLINVMQELNWEKYNRLGRTETLTDKDGQRFGHIKDWTKRNDHRHHALDAITIAFTRSEFIQYLNNLSARSDKSGSIYAIERKFLYRDSHNTLRFKPPMPLDELRSSVKFALESILVSHKAKNKVVTKNTNIIKCGNSTLKKVQLTPRGKLHNETVHSACERYHTFEERVNASFDADKIKKVASKKYREALLNRLEQFNWDPQKAFTGKNSLEKNPLYLNPDHTSQVPTRVKLVEMETIYTVKKPIDDKIVIDKVVDAGIKRILQERLAQFEGDPKKAFSGLDENPIYLDAAKTIKIKSVKVTGISNAEALHSKRDSNGNTIIDPDGQQIATDFVSPNNNHHIAIYRDTEGNLQENVVPFFTAVARATAGLPIIDRDYRRDDGWTFLFTMKKNEYFVFPRYETRFDENGNEVLVKIFDPNEINLTDPDNARIISPNLFRVQKLASKNYMFRHHLETTVDDVKELRNTAWIKIQRVNNLEGIVKVRVNHLGQITHFGE